MTTETTFTIGGVKYTPDQLWAVLTSKAEIQEMTVAVKEKRDRGGKYEGLEKFFSANTNYRPGWEVVRSLQGCSYEEMQMARQLQMKAIQKDAMDKEAWLMQCMSHSFAKDGITPIWRQANNPYVVEGWDIQEAFRLVQTGQSTVERR